ncbi:MAG: hypothetical protein D3924_14345 [Candidatus Electrothrix sp. AR4]|nr:hypothetical protein [Candidatus Electrothrix sp. AR4]
MNINGLLKTLPMGTLRHFLNFSRSANNLHEKIEAEYYKRLLKLGNSDVNKTERAVPAEELTPVFVLSTGRCGTKTMAALADLMPNVDSHHEPDPILFEASYLYFMKFCSDTPGDFWQKLLAANRDELIRQANRSGKIYFETNNRMALLCDLLIEHYPKAKFVHPVRHPCDFVRSGIRRNYFNSHSWDFARITPLPREEFHAKWNETSQLEKCAWLWAKTNSHIDSTLQNISADRKLFMRSEDIFNNTGNCVQTVLSFIDEEKIPDSKKIEKVLGMKLNQQTYGRFPKSGDWSPEESEILRYHCGALMEKYGYEL